MKLILARHGETFGNINKINQGQMQGELTHKGRLQAISLGKRLSEEKLDAIFVSDLRRCVQTAEHILPFHPNALVFYESMLRERCLGYLEGSKRGDVVKATELSGLSLLDFKPEGGESINDVKRRVKTFYEQILKEYHGKTVLVISHGQYIANTILLLLGLDDTKYDSYWHENTAITIIDVFQEPKIHVSNCTKHLDNVL